MLGIFGRFTPIRVASVALLLLAAIVIVLPGGRAGSPSLPRTGLHALRVPPGFIIEKVAGPGLLSYPMLGTFDERGRLFLCESSGNTLTTKEMAARPDYVVRMLEDTNGDGIFDRSQVFADKLTLPAGAVWYRGALYVAAPPDLLRLEDTDGDGVADRREAVVTGWNLSSNAASLHGPFFGPDGWLYLTDGRHGFNITSKEGAVLKGLASRIWRVRPDGSGLEAVAGGGFDNPVELIFTPAGETIGTMTYFQDPRDGERDALLHFVWGGVYPKWHPAASEFRRTGELMPVMTRFARIAPAGLERYRGAAFGPAYRGNLFSAQFNPHRVQRHILTRDGATFRTEDQDFLTSSDPDFHPTDVIEDADGSLLVVDTGAWFIHGCPISRVAKPEIKGGVYRIRKAGAPRVRDPRGESLQLERKAPADLAAYLEDPRPAVRDRALERLVEAGDPAVPTLARVRARAASYEPRAAAVWGLYRIGTPAALAELRGALSDPAFQVRVAAARAAGMARDRQAVDRLMTLVRDDLPAARRQAATALGQIGDRRAVPALLAAAARPADRFVEHALIYALIELEDSAGVAPALTQSDPRVRKAALIALDQMPGGRLAAPQVAALLGAHDAGLRAAALWVAARHPDWSGEVLKFLAARFAAPALAEAEAGPVREALVAFCADSGVQALVADALAAPRRQMFLLDTMDRCDLREFPASWSARLGELLERGDPAVRARALALVRARAIPSLDDALRRLASNPQAAAELRASALGALVARHPALEGAAFDFLLAHLDARYDAGVRLAAAGVLARARLADSQLLALARRLAHADALILPGLLDAFRASRSEAVGRALVGALLQSHVSIGEPDARRLETILGDYPDAVRAAARPLLARVEQLRLARLDRLRQLEPLLSAGGDVGRGRRVFFGEKVGCYRCHTIGKQGGHVGPDLTAVGAIRSGHDLLEAIVFPSASFVPGHEIYIVETATDTFSGVRGDGPPGTVTLITGPDAEIRIPRSQVRSMRPSSVSLMPEGLDESLTRQELTDLLAFLQGQTSREIAHAR